LEEQSDLLNETCFGRWQPRQIVRGKISQLGAPIDFGLKKGGKRVNPVAQRLDVSVQTCVSLENRRTSLNLASRRMKDVI
jgi:hypothetical protein